MTAQYSRLDCAECGRAVTIGPEGRCPACGEPYSTGTTLPPGKTCAACLHLSRCKWLLSRDGTERYCDWSPSRFRETVTA